MTNSTAIPLDFASQTAITRLSDTALERAAQICQTLKNSDMQWDCYLRSLALQGVKQWLEEGSTPYRIQLDAQGIPDSLTMLQVNGLRVGVIPVGSLPPEAAYIAQDRVGREPVHLWLLVEVQEELGQVWVVSGLEGQQVASCSVGLTAEGNYTLPLTAFTLSPDRVLFYLAHMSPALAAAPQSETAVPLSTRVMNVGRWLQDQLDEVAQQLAWTLLEPLTPAVAMRSPTQELETILTELEPLGISVPARMRAAFTEIQVAAVPLRLYALVWSVLESATPEWSLLVFLGPSPGEMLPSGITLRLRDADTVLTEQSFSEQSEATYLYAQVLGRWDETFTLEIQFPESNEFFTFPPFSFQPIE